MADVSSYNQPFPKSAIEQAQQYGAVEQQITNIERGKLELAIRNQDQLLRQLQGIDPETVTPEILRKTGQNAVKMKLVTPEMYAQWATNIPADPAKARDYLKNEMGKAQSINDALNWQYGQMSAVDTGNAIQPVVTRGRDQQMYSAGAPIPRQIPPTVEQTNPVTGERGLRGVQPSLPIEGAPQMQPSPLSRQPALPVAPPQMAPAGPLPVKSGMSNNLGGNVIAAEAEQPSTFAQQFDAGARSPATAPTPLFEEGKKSFSSDQQEASQRAMRIKPLAQAIELIQKPGMLSGPLSEQFTQAVAALKTFGLIDQAANDPTAIRQEVAKKLAQYVQGNPVGQRSDSAQILAEASSPNPKAQTIQALLKLSKDAIALDRVQIAMPNVFKDKDFSKYGSHKSVFPQSIDERAFSLDFEKDFGQGLVDTMAKKLKGNSKEKSEAEKFFKSLRIAKEQGFY